MPRDEIHRKWRDRGRPGAAPSDDLGKYYVDCFGDTTEVDQLFNEILKKLDLIDSSSDADSPDTNSGEKAQLIPSLKADVCVLKQKIESGYVGVFERMLLFDAVGRSSLSHNLVLNDRLPFTSKSVRRPIRLAVLETGFELDDENNPSGMLFDDQKLLNIDRRLGGWIPCESSAGASWRDMFLRQLEQALHDGADVICAGEFGFPVSDNEETNEAFVQNIRDRLERTDRPVMLIGGSRHWPISATADQGEALYNENVAMVFASDKAIPPKNTCHLNDQPLRHYKVSPASRIGERLFVGGSTELPVYKTPFGNIGLLVCSDAFDSRIHLSYLRDNHSMRNRAQVILVPSFNKSPLLVECCRYLSYLANCVVIYINSAEGDFQRGSIQTFICGLQDRELESFHRKNKEAFGEIYSATDPVFECVKSDRPTHVKTTPLDQAGQPRELVRRISMHEIDPNKILGIRNVLETMSGKLREAARKIGKEYNF